MQPGRSADWEAEGLNTSCRASFIMYVFMRELVQPLKPFAVQHTQGACERSNLKVAMSVYMLELLGVVVLVGPKT